jgi:hypothetical protein
MKAVNKQLASINTPFEGELLRSLLNLSPVVKILVSMKTSLSKSGKIFSSIDVIKLEQIEFNTSKTTETISEVFVKVSSI